MWMARATSSRGRPLPSGAARVYAYPALEANLDGLVDAAAALEIAERAVATAAVRTPTRVVC